MTAALFSGVGVALATLFTDDGEVDVAATAAHAERLVGLGVQAVVVAGSTGEAAALSAAERMALLEAVRPVTPYLVAGSGAPTADEAVAFTTDAVAAGADAVLTLSPPGTDDPRPYYEAVRTAAGDLALLGYHFPKMSEPGIAVDRLAGLPIDGVKDSSGDPDRLLAELEAFDRPIYVGSSALLSLAGPVGAHGAILALANLEPERCAAAFAGGGSAQRALAAAHLASGQDFPRGLKRLMAEKWATNPTARL